MADKTINEFVQEMKQAFGAVEFCATNNETGQTVTSKGRKGPPPMVAISSEDYLRLGNLKAGHPAPSAEAFELMMKLAMKA